jgi:serine/threonine protein kinase
VLHQVGAGSLGPVFRAHDPVGGRLVAIKAFRLDLTPEQAAELAVELEDLAANQPQHPGMAAALAAGVEGVTPYLAQEYVAGEALDAVLRQFGPPPPAEALTTLRRVADALDRAAGEAIHHGMLHPRDILVADDGDARVIDLGVAQALVRSGLRLPVRRPYSAPECVEDRSWGGAADIFSLGAIAYELLTGKRLADPALPDVDIPGLTPELNARVGDALARALQRDPASRYPSAADLVDVLSPLLPAATRTTRRKTRPPADLTMPLPLEPEPAAAAETVVMERFDPAMDPQLGASHDLPPSPLDELPIAAAPAAPRFHTLDDERDDPAPPVVDEPKVEPPQAARGVGPTPPSGWLREPPPETTPIARRPYLPLAMALLVGVAAGFGWGYWTAHRALSGATVADSTPAAAVDSAPPAEPPVRVEDPEVIGERYLPPPTAAPPSRAAREEPARTVPASPQRPNTPAAAAAPPTRATAAPSAPRSSPGRLTIRSTPAGAAVRVDGRLRGRTPLVIRDLPLRVVRVTLQRDGYQPDDRRVALSAARPSVTLESTLTPVKPAPPAETTGTLVVESRPVGATVYVDGQALGVTPLSLPDLAPGTRRIRLQLAGFSPWVTTAQVQAGTRTRVAASLERGTPE